MWEEIECVSSENRHELILHGNEISKRIEQSGLDKNLFNLTSLNLLQISDTVLDTVPDEISKLVNLQTLVLHSNKIKTVTEKIGELSKLKILDLSSNQLSNITDNICQLSQLTSLNLSSNELKSFPNISKCLKIAILNLSHNKLNSFPDICHNHLVHLSEVILKTNEITSLPNEINVLSALKVLDLSFNKISSIPGEISDCNKLKELNLKNNPIQDKRFLKLIEQCRTKQVLDYARQHCLRDGGKAPVGGNKKSGKKSKADNKSNDNENKNDTEVVNKTGPKIIVAKVGEEEKIPNIRITEEVKGVRPYIVGCVIKDLSFDEKSLQKFLRMQTKLHETICEKRSAATIATHDLSKILNVTATTQPQNESNETSNLTFDLIYTAQSPNSLKIRPLNRGGAICTGAQLFQQLRTEAENLRREKKRNTFSGIHRYLHFLDNRPLFPCVCDATGKVISFPPITNSADTQIEFSTKNVLVEVTSSTSLFVCRKVLDELLKETLLLGFGNVDSDVKLVVQRIKTVDLEGNLKTVYPSRTDLNYDEKDGINVVRE